MAAAICYGTSTSSGTNNVPPAVASRRVRLLAYSPLNQKRDRMQIEGSDKNKGGLVGPESAFAEVKKPKFRITIEPVAYLFITAIIVQHVVTQNLFLLKLCVVNFNLSHAICDPSASNASANPFLTNLLQGYASVLNIYVSLIDNIPSIFFVLFLGPWSEGHGRKPLIIIPIVGRIISTLIFIINYYSPDLSVEYLLLASVPTGLCGGMISMTMVLNSYLVDITTEQSRTYRMAFLAGLTTLAVPLANLLSVFIYNNGGYIAVWGTVLGIFVINILYVIFFVPETRGKRAKEQIVLAGPTNVVKPFPDQGEDGTLHKDAEANLTKELVAIGELARPKPSCSSVFKNLWKCFTVTFRPRAGYQRACVCLLLAGLCVNLFSGANRMTIYLYTRKKFGWDAPDFALFTSVTGGLVVIGTLVILPLASAYFKVHDGIIGVISLLGQIIGFLVIAFAITPLMMYLCNTISPASIGMILAIAIMVVIRSTLSKVVPKEELSHVYAVSASIESIIPLFASPFFNLVYRATLATFPGCVFILNACFESSLLIIFLTVLYLQWKEKKMTLVRPVSQQSIVSSIKNDA